MAVSASRLKIFVVAGFIAGDKKAHIFNTINTAIGFDNLGHDVTIICYRRPRKKYSRSQLAQMYDVSERVKWIQIPQLNNRFIQMTIHREFGLATLAVAMLLRPDVIYARNYLVPFWTARFKFTTVAESHAHVDFRSRNFLTMIAATRFPHLRKLVTISPTLKDYYTTIGFDTERIAVLPTGVVLSRFVPPATLPPSPYNTTQKNVAYVGHLYDYKGIPQILDAAAHLPDVQFHLVGGLDDDIQRQSERVSANNLTNVILHGFKQQSDLGAYLWHADVLLLPPSQHHASAEWTSPVKLGEYLASGTPVIATDIPALRHWLDDSIVDFCEPDDGAALVTTIKHVLTSPDTKQDKRRAMAEHLSVTHRAKQILQGL